MYRQEAYVTTSRYIRTVLRKSTLTPSCHVERMVPVTIAMHCAPRIRGKAYRYSPKRRTAVGSRHYFVVHQREWLGGCLTIVGGVREAR